MVPPLASPVRADRPKGYPLNRVRAVKTDWPID